MTTGELNVREALNVNRGPWKDTIFELVVLVALIAMVWVVLSL